MTGSATDRSAARLRLLHELGCAFAARLDLGELNTLVLQQCREVLNAEAAALLLLDANRGEFYFPYSADEDAAAHERLASIRFPVDRGIAGQVVRRGISVRVDDVSKDSSFYGGVDQRTGLVTRNLLCAPLQSRQGIIGVIQVINHRGGVPFADDDLDFLDALAGSIAVAIENARLYAQLKQQVAALERAVHEHNELIALRRELDLAREIQESILPRGFPPFPERSELEIYATMEPAREVGGDFYDFFLVDQDHLGLVIGDVSGKGVPAALFMAMSRTLLKSIALEGAAPGDCLRRVNRLLCLDNSSEMFVSLFYGVLDLRNGALTYANGGHNPPALIRASASVEALPGTGGVVLAALPDSVYSANTVTLHRGDGLCLYTDGVTEAMDSAQRMYSADALHALLAQSPTASAESIVHAVVQAVRRHAGETAQSDDITVLVARYLG